MDAWKGLLFTEISEITRNCSLIFSRAWGMNGILSFNNYSYIVIFSLQQNFRVIVTCNV